MKKSPFVIALSLATVMAAGHLSAKPALRDVPEITEGLIAVGIAYEISQKCDSINARLVRGLTTLNALKSRARALGYTNAEIEAFTDNKAEQDRLETIARQRLAGLGAVEGNEQSYCSVGQAEIAAGSAIGRLLR